MLDRLSFYWRMFATGLSFAAFGMGGLLLRLVVFPLLNLLVWQRQKRIVLARTVIRLTFRAFVGLMHILGVLHYEIIGRTRLERDGLLILANHPTLIDTVFLMAFVKRANCIVKSGLWNNPFTRGPVRAAEYINNDQDQGMGLLNNCIVSLQRGDNLIVFPEGTRTPRNGAIALKRGAANIAVRGARNVTPVHVRCIPMTLGKGEKWWHVPPRLAYFQIEVGEDIPIKDFIAGGVTEVMAARHLTEYLQTYFTKEDLHHA
ncbi:MAG: lysophospholipid acyltransferase family protein [Burkholderiaceae bacterium]